MTKILVPIDGSRHSIRALEFVAARARRGEKLDVQVLFNQPTAMPTEYVTRDMIKYWQRSERAKVFANRKVRTLTSKLKAHIAVEIGDTAKVIVDYARRNRCREIVMGTRGLGRLKGLLMGSIATKVAQLATVPVTLVK